MSRTTLQFRDAAGNLHTVAGSLTGPLPLEPRTNSVGLQQLAVETPRSITIVLSAVVDRVALRRLLGHPIYRIKRGRWRKS